MMGIYDPNRDSLDYTPELLSQTTREDVIASYITLLDAETADMKRWGDASRSSDATQEALCIHEMLALNYTSNLCE